MVEKRKKKKNKEKKEKERKKNERGPNHTASPTGIANYLKSHYWDINVPSAVVSKVQAGRVCPRCCLRVKTSLK